MSKNKFINGERILIGILLLLMAVQYFYVEHMEIKGCQILAVEKEGGVRYSYNTTSSYVIDTSSCSANCMKFNVSIWR